MRYGDFLSLCQRSPLPVCRLFGDVVLPTCHLNPYEAGDAYFVNLPDFVISIIALLVTLYLGFRAHRRLDAVGFQIMADGSFASILSIVVSTAIVFIGFGFMAADTAFGISSGLKPKPSDPFYSPGLFTMYLVFPLVALVVYITAQSIIVVKYLAVRLPLIWLFSSLVCFAVAQVLLFVASKKICTGSNGKIDGAFFATLLDSAAVFCIYGFWTSITEDDTEEYEGGFKY
ncbi:hypothetical protein LPJ60_003867 [Coemansia sp. RSA 2675]|uniref:Uncharacterized protein n=1 Tax=Coemansia linderi TaxID=2663919 RepID=A0ACC1KH34_9FUNG|nr:hypothetical protein LPJ60_003867 [Coemansia sp. RSA 2675]KAJ2416991.1 hypothetical protein GGI10_000543 [Coemansia sp. RSA 2530]KAJ2789740.1 hypothetical protein GGI18_002227 [Coemansia linderi]